MLDLRWRSNQFLIPVVDSATFISRIFYVKRAFIQPWVTAILENDSYFDTKKISPGYILCSLKIKITTGILDNFMMLAKGSSHKFSHKKRIVNV